MHGRADHWGAALMTISGGSTPVSKTTRVLLGTAIGSCVGIANAIFVGPYAPGHEPKTIIGLVAAYVIFLLPFAFVGGVIAAFTSRKKVGR